MGIGDLFRKKKEIEKTQVQKGEDSWTKEEVDTICMYYGQIPENLPYNLKAILVEKFEKEFQPKIEKAYNEVIKYPN